MPQKEIICLHLEKVYKGELSYHLEQDISNLVKNLDLISSFMPISSASVICYVISIYNKNKGEKIFMMEGGFDISVREKASSCIQDFKRQYRKLKDIPKSLEECFSGGLYASVSSLV